MTKSQNTKNEQQKDLCITSEQLTEQWKRGEFIICNAGKCQYYYVQNEEQREVIKTEYCLFDDNTPNWQILAPVPSYEEWKASYNCMLENEVLRLKNAQLKELLKECRRYIDIWGYTDTHGNALLPQIDEALQ